MRIDPQGYIRAGIPSRNWQRDAIQSPHLVRRSFGPLEPSRMQLLVVFTGGGGAQSEWYQYAISSTYERFQYRNYRIPPYKLVEVPMPVDLAMYDLPRMNSAGLRPATAFPFLAAKVRTSVCQVSSKLPRDCESESLEAWSTTWIARMCTISVSAAMAWHGMTTGDGTVHGDSFGALRTRS
jgi:hypothetical protein